MPRVDETSLLSPPFLHVIALDYYDGPTMGLATDVSHLHSYRFDIAVWDDQQDIRIYQVAILPVNTFDRAIAVLAPLGPPSWPVWVPQWQSINAEQLHYLEDAIDSILSKSIMASYLIASRNLTKELLHIQPIDANNPNQANQLLALALSQIH